MGYRVVRAVLVAAARVWPRVRIAGIENIPGDGGFVLAPTHRSNIDFVLAGAVTKRRLQFMTKDSVWRIRALGALAERLGGFPVNRGAPDRDAIRRSEAALIGGLGLVMFPEGERKSGTKIENLHDGVVYVAARARVPVIPVGIAGSEVAMPPGSWFVRPRRRIRIEVGAPMSVDRERDGPMRRSDIRALTAQLRTELQELFDRASSS